MTLPVTVHAVALDLDGTLLDTLPDIAVAAQRMLQHILAADPENKLDVLATSEFAGAAAQLLAALPQARGGNARLWTSSLFAATSAMAYRGLPSVC